MNSNLKPIHEVNYLRHLFIHTIYKTCHGYIRIYPTKFFAERKSSKEDSFTSKFLFDKVITLNMAQLGQFAVSKKLNIHLTKPTLLEIEENTTLNHTVEDNFH